MTQSQISDRTIPALQRQQRWLSQAWAGYEAAVDEGREPNEDSLRQLMARDLMFQAAMSSAVRAGLDHCINAPGDCSEAFVSCQHCAPAAPQTDDKPLVVSNHTGRSRDGSLWLIETLNF